MRNPLSLLLKTTTLLILVVCLFIPEKALSAVFLDRVVATVDGEVITWSEMMDVIEVEGAKMLEGLNGDEKGKRIKELENIFLNSMIDVKLQLMEARRFGLKVSDGDIEAAMADVKVKYNLSAEAFKESLETEGFTMEEYRTRLSEQILISKISGFEVKSNILITDAEIEEYYEAASGSSINDEVKIRQIFFAIPDDETKKTELESMAMEIVKRIKNGENFGALAIEFSEGPSREFGGDLGFVGHGTVLKEVEDVAFALDIGEVSSPFWSTAGLHIIKVEEKREDRELAQSRDRIRDALLQKKYIEKYDQWIKMLREKAYIEVNL